VEEDRVLCIVLWFADHVSPTTLRERCVDFFFPFSLHLHFCTYPLLACWQCAQCTRRVILYFNRCTKYKHIGWLLHHLYIYTRMINTRKKNYNRAVCVQTSNYTPPMTWKKFLGNVKQDHHCSDIISGPIL
jgi:hypothetical protein